MPGRSRVAAEPADRLFRSSDVQQLLKLSRRQLQYWADTDLVRPTVRTQGGHHRYTLEDLVALKAAKRLIDAGVSVQRIRKSIQALRKILPTVRRPLAELVLVTTGDVVLVLQDGSAFEAATGQEWIFVVARFEREVALWRERRALAATRKLRPARTSRAIARSA